MTEEIWKPISGYEGKYQVSNLGRVKSLKDSYGNYREKFLKIFNRGNNYCYVELYFNNKSKKYSIHRLVANSFIPNPDNLPIINHKDENPMNNCVDNLEWCSFKYNNCYGTRLKKISKKLSKKIGCYKDNKLIKIYNSIISTKKDGYLPSKVCQCCKGNRNTHHGFNWRYIED